MHTRASLVPPVVLLNLVMTAFANGACEPWASDIHPSDVSRSHVQEITASPFTYQIEQHGTMDGKTTSPSRPSRTRWSKGCPPSGRRP